MSQNMLQIRLFRTHRGLMSLLASFIGLIIADDYRAQAADASSGLHPDITKPGTPIDDKALENRWLEAMQKLEDDGAKIADGNLLTQQLKSRPSCKIPNPPRPVTCEPTTTPNWPVFYKNHVGKTVSVLARYKCGRCSRWHLRDCGGLVLSADGVVATNHHVMDQTDSTISAIGLADGSIFPIQEVLAADATADVAIVRAQMNGRSLTAPGLCVDTPVGSAVGLISTPGDAHFFFTTGVVSRYGFWPYNGQQAARMDITADFARGSSGFPVYDSTGNAVGIVTSTTSFHVENQNGKKENLQMVFKHCVPMRSILRLIEGSLP
jgi:hypothetical protein